MIHRMLSVMYLEWDIEWEISMAVAIFTVFLVGFILGGTASFYSAGIINETSNCPGG